MLHNPNWDKPSLAGFLAFCRSKPEEVYYWGNNDTCACAQYYKSIGMFAQWEHRLAPSLFSIPDAELQLMGNLDKLAFQAACRGISSCETVTFGDLANYIEANT